MKGCLKISLVLAGVCVLLVAGCGVLATYTSFDLGLITLPFKQNAGRFDRKLMESIVEKVRHSKLEPDTQATFSLDPITGAISPTKRELDLYGSYVSAVVSPSGRLKVVIVTRNLGHAGSYGFAFSDDPWAPSPWEHGIYYLDVPFHVDMTRPSMKIDDHW